MAKSHFSEGKREYELRKLRVEGSRGGEEDVF